MRAWLLRILTNLNIDRGRRVQRAPDMQPLEEGDYFLYNRLEEDGGNLDEERVDRPALAGRRGRRPLGGAARLPRRDRARRHRRLQLRRRGADPRHPDRDGHVPVAPGTPYPEAASSPIGPWRTRDAHATRARSARSCCSRTSTACSDRRGAGRGGAASRRLQLLPQALRLRGAARGSSSASRSSSDAARAQAEARGAADASLAGSAGRAQQAGLGGPVITTSRRASRPPGSGLIVPQPSWDASRRASASPPGSK